MADGKVLIDIDGNTKEFESALSGLGSIAEKSLALVTGAVVGVGAAFTVAATKSLLVASNLQEIQNVVDVTFGEGAKQIEAFADAAGEAFGLSEIQAKKYTSTLGAMYKSMGLGEKETLEMSQRLAGLTGDMASFYNLDHEVAFQKIQSGISGEIEPLRQLGINLSVANLEAYAMAQGFEVAFSEMSEAEKATLRYNYILEQTADAQGDFARTSEGFANQLRLVGMETETVANTFGQYLLPIATKAVSGIREAIKTLGDGLDDPRIMASIETIGGGIATLVTSFVDLAVYAIPEILEGFATLVENIDQVGLALAVLTGAFVGFKAAAVLTSLITAFGTLKTAIQGATAAQLALNAMIAANPLGLLLTAISSVVAAFGYWYVTEEKFREASERAWYNFMLGVKKIFDVFRTGILNPLITAYNHTLNVFGKPIPTVDPPDLRPYDEYKKSLENIGETSGSTTGEIEDLNSKVNMLTLNLEEAANKAKETGAALKDMPIVGGSGNSNGFTYKSGDNFYPTLSDAGLYEPQDMFYPTKEEMQAQGEEQGDAFSDGVADGILDGGVNIGDALGSALRSALTGEQTWSDAFKEMGQNLMGSLADSMLNDGLNYLNKAVSSILDYVIGSFNTGFGIASPSKVFGEMGYWNMQGLATGISDNAGLVDKSIAGISSLASSYAPSFDYSGLQAQASMMPSFAVPPSGSFSCGNVYVTTINNASGTTAETTEKTLSNGDREITTVIESTVNKNLATGGTIWQNIKARQSAETGTRR